MVDEYNDRGMLDDVTCLHILYTFGLRAYFYLKNNKMYHDCKYFFSLRAYFTTASGYKIYVRVSPLGIIGYNYSLDYDRTTAKRLPLSGVDIIGARRTL